MDTTRFTTRTRTLGPGALVVSLLDATGRVVASTPVVLGPFAEERLQVLAVAHDLARTAGLSAFPC